MDYDKKQGEEFYEKFATYFNGALDDSTQNQVIKTGTVLLKKRFRAFPGFENYLNFIMEAEKEISADNLITWLINVAVIIDDAPGKKGKDFVEASLNIVRSGILSKTSSSTWLVRNAEIVYHPSATEPYFSFKDADVICRSDKDSLQIWETEGLYYPIEEEFVGNGGQVYWDRANFPRDSAYAVLGPYKFDARKNSYEADSVELHSQYYVTRVLLGKLEDKLTGNKQGTNAIYPEFKSYDKEVELRVDDDVRFLGGFIMEGAKFKGYGNVGSRAGLYFNYEDKLLVKCAANSFTLRENRISSGEAAVYIYLDTDSIFHPNLRMRYDLDERKLSLTRDEEGIAKTPLFNTYHEVDMYFNELVWFMDEPKMEINNGLTSTLKPVTFESSEYFTLDKYNALKGMDPVHPMWQVYKMVERSGGGRIFPIQYIADYLKMTVSQAKILMMNMTILGFAEYELETDEVEILNRMYDFLEMKKGDRDYDVIQFRSLMKAPKNATLSLLDYNMDMRGVGKILLSDSQDVVIYPKDQEIILKRNRDFDFAGQVKAGRFDFYGYDLHFEYDNFFLNLNQIDSLRFKVPSFVAEPDGSRPLRQVRTPLRDLSGVLYIDKVFNKSGKEVFSEYPIFKSGKECFVYYDYQYIAGGAYNKEDFYFKVDPFELDSLDNFNTETLEFNGMLASAGIFPDMRRDLTVQDDYSLGFDIALQPSGLSAYGGKGTFKDSLKLSNEGLIGNGVIEYLTSTAESDAFYFLPEQVTGDANAFNVRAVADGTQYPKVLGKDDKINWLPYQDKLHATNSTTPFEIFEANYTHNGGLTVTPDGLLGKGLLKFETAETESNDYVFGYNSFNSDKTAFRLDQVDGGPWTIKITNALANVDFDRRKGKFTLNDKEDYISFPLNEYICYMDEIDWDMDARLIDIKNTGGADYSPLVSVKESQDSLQFVAGRARYVMDDYFLEAFEVDHIDVADAAIYPTEKYVAIEKNAYMQPIDKAHIEANRLDKYHTIYNASAQIYSRGNYKGKGKVDYRDELAKKYTIDIDTVGVKDGTTFGLGKIAADDNFKLSPFFAYYGDVTLNGDKRWLFMDGKTHIQSTCEKIKTDWIPIHAEANPKDIYVDLSLMGKMGKEDTLQASLMWSADSAAVYSIFMGRPNGKKDASYFTTGGMLWFDNTANKYYIASAEAKNDPELYAQRMALDARTCNVEVEGQFDFNERMGVVNVDPIGFGTFNSKKGTAELKVTMATEFHFSDDALALMANEFYNEPTLGGVDLENDAFQMAVYKWVEKEKDANKYLDDLSMYGSSKKLPKGLEKTMVFTELKLLFNDELNAFISKGQFGLANAGENQVNLLMDGVIAIEKGRSEDELHLYLEASPSSSWFYFHYNRNRMEALAANNQFDTILKELKDSKRSVKQKDAPTYYFMAGTSKRSLAKILDR